MAVDLRGMRDQRARDTVKTGSDFGKGPGFFDFDEGTTLVYVCPPTEAMKGIPYVRVDRHRGVGPGSRPTPVICLHPENPVLSNPEVLRYLAERKIGLSGKCPTCVLLDSETPPAGYTEERLGQMGFKPAYFMALIPWARLGKDNAVQPYSEAEKIPRISIMGPQCWDAVCKVIEETGDVTDPNAAVLVRVHRGPKNSQPLYTASADVDTVRVAMVLPKPQKALLRKAQEPGGDLDLYRCIAYMIKDEATMTALLRGEEVHTQAASADPGKPHCFGLDCDPKDDTCVKCGVHTDCAVACKIAWGGAAAPVAQPMRVAAPAQAAPAAAPVAQPAPRAAAPAVVAPVAQAQPAVDPTAGRGATRTRQPARVAAPVAAPAPVKDDLPGEYGDQGSQVAEEVPPDDPGVVMAEAPVQGSLVQEAPASQANGDSEVDAFEKALQARRNTRSGR